MHAVSYPRGVHSSAAHQLQRVDSTPAYRAHSVSNLTGDVCVWIQEAALTQEAAELDCVRLRL